MINEYMAVDSNTNGNYEYKQFRFSVLNKKELKFNDLKFQLLKKILVEKREIQLNLQKQELIFGNLHSFFLVNRSTHSRLYAVSIIPLHTVDLT